MMQLRDLRGMLLAAYTGLFFLAAIWVRAWFPRVLFFRFDAVTAVLLTLITHVTAHRLTDRTQMRELQSALYAVFVFGLFPWASGIASPGDAVLHAAVGGGLYVILTCLFDSMTDRLASGPAAKAAPTVCACGLFLAFQCLLGMV